MTVQLRDKPGGALQLRQLALQVLQAGGGFTDLPPMGVEHLRRRTCLFYSRQLILKGGNPFSR
ncbi:hypothetical protein D3C74_507160 [compost metagenome]